MGLPRVCNHGFTRMDTDFQPRMDANGHELGAGISQKGRKETKSEHLTLALSPERRGEAAAKVVNIFFEFLFPPTTTTKTKSSENARTHFNARRVREKTGRISAACAVRAALADSFCGARRNREKRYDHE